MDEAGGPRTQPQDLLSPGPRRPRPQGGGRSWDRAGTGGPRVDPSPLGTETSIKNPGCRDLERFWVNEHAGGGAPQLQGSEPPAPRARPGPAQASPL